MSQRKHPRYRVPIAVYLASVSDRPLVEEMWELKEGDRLFSEEQPALEGSLDLRKSGSSLKPDDGKSFVLGEHNVQQDIRPNPML